MTQRRLYKHLKATGWVQYEPHFTMKSKVWFTEEEFLESNHKSRSTLLYQLKLAGLYKEVEYFKLLSDVLITKTH
jgi:hypothetical protein